MRTNDITFFKNRLSSQCTNTFWSFTDVGPGKNFYPVTNTDPRIDTNMGMDNHILADADVLPYDYAFCYVAIYPDYYILFYSGEMANCHSDSKDGTWVIYRP